MVPEVSAGSSVTWQEWLLSSSTEQVDRQNLHEVYEAYQVFCENGSHRIAWRNLAIFLTTYLRPRFGRSEDGGLDVKPSYPPRIQYLQRLDIAQLGYLTNDVLYVLLLFTGFVSTIGEDNVDYNALQALVRKKILSLPQHELHALLAEITNELNNRTSLSDSRTGNPISSLCAPWRPTSRSNPGILYHLDVQLTEYEVSLLDQLGGRKEGESKFTIYDLPKKLLRRAFSVGSGTMSKRQLSAVKPPGDERDRPSLKSPAEQIPATHLVTTNQQKSRLQKRPASWHFGSTVTDQETVQRIYQQSLYDQDKNSALDYKTYMQDEIKPKAAVRLEAITEEAEEVGSMKSSYEASSWSDDDDDDGSTHTSQTLESLLDYYGKNIDSRNPSLKSVHVASRRSSIDSAELSRFEYRGGPSSHKNLLDDRSSVTSGGSRSVLSGHHSFVTARSQVSAIRSNRISKRSSIESFISIETTTALNVDIGAPSPYYELLRERDLIPMPAMETDWSGRGQHAEYSPEERDKIPLQVEKFLGRTQNALVESVLCKRIRLVRKIMRCNKRTGFKREDALREVQHLYNVQHSHIVRLVGTYVSGPNLAILTYPCAEWNLEQFMRSIPDALDAVERYTSLRQFFTCLAKVLDFMHSFPLKHMDIKPQNL